MILALIAFHTAPGNLVTNHPSKRMEIAFTMVVGKLE
jgi:hypothetical protein